MQKEYRTGSEEPQKEYRTSKNGGKGRILWMEIIDRGGELPGPGDVNYGKFKRAFKQWYNEFCDPKGVNNDHIKARNKYYYDVGKEHLESLGVILTEIKKTGSVQINTPKPFGHSDDNDIERVFSYAID